MPKTASQKKRVQAARGKGPWKRLATGVCSFRGFCFAGQLNCNTLDAMEKRKHRSIVTAVVDLLRTTPQHGRGDCRGHGKRPVWQIQTCQYCGKQGHNTRSCPVLGLKVLKKLQVKHSVTAVTKAIMVGANHWQRRESRDVVDQERQRGD